MQAAGMLPSPRTHTLLLSAYANAGQPEKAEAHISALETAYVSGKSTMAVDMHMYNCLLRAYGKAGRWKQMEDLLAILEEGVLQPTTVTYNTVIGAYAEGERMDEAERVFQGMEKKGVYADVGSWTALINGFAKKRLFRKCKNMCLKMIAEGILPDDACVRVLYRACRSDEQLQEMRMMLDKAIAKSS